VSQPAAAVIIPTRNRKDLLGKAIASALAQTAPLEIFVMDDASTDGTSEMMKAEFPSVGYHRSDTCIGPTAERNRGAAMATAPYLVTLDDDCVLQSPRTVEQTLALFGHPRVGAVTIPYVNVLQDKIERGGTKAGHPQVTYHYLGGMIIFRRDAYLAVGGYREYLFMHVEEPDLATRLLGGGWVIRLGTADPIHHYESPVRDRPRLDVLGPRNHVLYAWYNVPMAHLPIHLAGTTFLTMRHGLRKGTTARVIWGLCRGYGGILHEIGQRRPVSRKTYRVIQLLKTRQAAPLEEIEPMLEAIKIDCRQ
jgi:glycosyltransferase involved in cell wall biosynthesis